MRMLGRIALRGYQNVTDDHVGQYLLGHDEVHDFFLLDVESWSSW